MEPKINFEELIESMSADDVRAWIWDYKREHHLCDLDTAWYSLEIDPYCLISADVAKIIRSFDSWGSDFEDDCLKALCFDANIDFDSYESYSDLAYDLEQALDIEL